MRQPLSFLGLPIYFKFRILFYTFTKTLGQRFDIFSFPHPDLLSPEIIVVLQQSSCFSDSLRMGFTIYYLLSLMCPVLNLWLHCNSCYIPQFISYLYKSCLPLTSWAQFSSVQSLSRVWLFATPWITACQASPTPRVHSDSRPSSQWCHPAISSSVVPFSSCPHSIPASESFPMSQLFTWGGQSTGVSALASFLPKKSQGWSPSEWTGWSPCSPRDSQGSSPTPQFKSINSSALSFLHSPTLTSIHDHRKNHSLD